MKRILFLSIIVLMASTMGINETFSAPAETIAEVRLAAKSEQVPLEIERKFLIDFNDIPENFIKQAERLEITQTYIGYDPEVRVRRVDWGIHESYFFTLKRPKDKVGLSRSELEFEISRTVYQELVKKRVGMTIQKTRLQLSENGHVICVDIYRNQILAGLAVAEVEFTDVKEAANFTPPKWFGRDVTSDKRYKNAHLAKDGKTAVR